ALIGAGAAGPGGSVSGPGPGAQDLSPVARSVALVAVGALAMTAALAVACFVKATGMTFLALPRTPEATAARESKPSELAGMALLAVLCVILGLGAGPVGGRIGEIATAALGGAGTPAAGLATVPGGPVGAGSVAPAALAIFAAVAVFLALVLMRPRRGSNATAGS